MHTPSRSIMVVFGGDGDLTKRKLIPSLYNLAAEHYLPDEFAVIGLARTEMTTGEYRRKLSEEIRNYATGPVDDSVWEWVRERLYYVTGDFRDPDAFKRLEQALADVSKTHGTGGNYLYYLATAPSFFCEIVRQLGAHGLTIQPNGAWRRVVIEKPFGHDLDSARLLNRELRQVLEEDQIYRIDHYLGKETVQNILVFRFANGIFEPVWNRRYIDHVQITVAESLGVEHRGHYYEEAGALRDMVPNHLLQLVSFIAMEPPNSFAADAVRDEKAKVLRAVLPLHPVEVLRSTVAGQYGDGIIDGARVPAYREESGVRSTSNTETYVAMKLLIDSWRWADVPFYLRTGKRMTKRVSEIVIQFKPAPFMLFRKTGVEHLDPNVLIIRIQPDEGISLRFDAKVPGPRVHVGTVDMDFHYSKYFGGAPSTGYETLLYDCLAGDATLFQRADNVEVGWSTMQPILDVWASLPPGGVPIYPAGTWGPPEADRLLERDGRQWWTPS
ncbi:MAG TPA: glucose-6-phosphate dehydrogenase [Nitrospiraceae bacterium]|nr:glucose-6-phosphate dehydrogenase [Nitrospiraceae bacterium]